MPRKRQFRSGIKARKRVYKAKYGMAVFNSYTRKPKKESKKHVTSSVSLGGDFTDEETAFLLAMDRYKRERNRPFPTYAEALAVAKSLGYRKVQGSD